jgi:squalene-hopene/tetraprenyl-beta-curcumene cyclase
MRNRAIGTYLSLGGCLALALWRAMPVHGAPAAPSTSWNRQTAALYLDEREVWWQAWPRAQRDQGTICISCHTVVPYAMVRPRLQQELGETGTPTPEKIMMDNIEKRVSRWVEMAPFYTDAKSGPGKSAESRATESVLNAVILASVDAQQGHLRPITRTGFDEAWALQEQTGDLAGAWKWQDFHLAPWESAESGYQGAALFMLETLNAPDAYAKEPAARQHLARLRDYLRRQYATQPVVNQLYILWASPRDSGLLPAADRKALLATLQSRQQPDGGWRTSALDKSERSDHSPDPTDSDGYATGLAVLAMEESGTTRSDPTLKRGLQWLAEHQEKDGAWSAASLNKKRDAGTDAALFMQDAATAYAVLALEKAK